MSPSQTVSPRGRLREGLARLGVALPTGGFERLERFRVELERWNRVHGFVKAEGEDLVVRHFLDSLAAWGVLGELEPRETILDVGSGAGFPGIPLAVAFPESRVTLLERSAKRAAFLRNACLLLRLPNTAVVEAQLEELTGRFDLVTFRAFSPLPRALPELLARVREGGWIAAYKGRKTRVEEEIAAMGLEPARISVRSLEVPFLEEERHLLLVRG
jgi:16S rRNA (guanine527-N7)-methyltransferase